MQSLADLLPPEFAQQAHPDWRKNEAAYWTVRDKLLSQYRDQWVRFADGSVIASGRSPFEVLHAAQTSGRHPLFICVGHESEPMRIRRSRIAKTPRWQSAPFRQKVSTPPKGRTRRYSGGWRRTSGKA